MRRFMLVAAVTLAGCVASANGPAERREQGNAVSLEFRIENEAGNVTRAFDASDAARFVFVVRNEGDVARRLSFTFPPHRVSVAAAKGGAPVWQAFHGQMFVQVMRHETIPAGDAVTFVVEWDLRTADGGPVPAGEYRVEPGFTGWVQPGREAFGPLDPVMINIGE